MKFIWGGRSSSGHKLKSTHYSLIDILRIMAVFAVVLYHAGSPYFIGGYLGVDIFFVISGFLIQRILTEKPLYKVSHLLNFLFRRLNRLAPSLLMVVILVFLVRFFFVSPYQYDRFEQSIAPSLYFYSNLYFWSKDSYFSDSTKFDFLVHTWSLSIEVQFYLALAILYLLLQYFSSAFKWKLIFLAMAVSFFLAIYFNERSPSASFYMPPTRFWEFLVGALAFRAYVYVNNAGYRNHLVPYIGLAVICISFGVFDDTYISPGIISLVPVLGAAISLIFMQSLSLPNSYMTYMLLSIFGSLAYPLYLIHHPVLALKYNEVINISVWPLILLSLAMSYLVWKFFENPIRKYGTNKRPWVTIAIFGFLALIPRSFDQLFSDQKFRYADYSPQALQMGNEASGDLFHLAIDKFNKNDLSECNKSVQNVDELVTFLESACGSMKGGVTLILGDSHGLDLFRMIALRSPTHTSIVGLTKGGARLMQEKNNYFLEVLEYLNSESVSKISRVIYTQRGAYLLSSSSGRPATYELIGRSQTAKVDLRPNIHQIIQVANYLGRFPERVKVDFIGPRIEPTINMREYIKKGCLKNWSINNSVELSFVGLDNFLSEYFSDTNNIRYISINDLIGFDFSRDLMTCENFFWRDETHFSLEGVREFSKRPNFTAFVNSTLGD